MNRKSNGNHQAHGGNNGNRRNYHGQNDDAPFAEKQKKQCKDHCHGKGGGSAHLGEHFNTNGTLSHRQTCNMKLIIPGECPDFFLKRLVNPVAKQLIRQRQINTDCPAVR